MDPELREDALAYGLAERDIEGWGDELDDVLAAARNDDLSAATLGPWLRAHPGDPSGVLEEWQDWEP